MQQISRVYSSYLTEMLCLAAEWRRWARKERTSPHNSIRGIKNAIHKYTNIVPHYSKAADTNYLWLSLWSRIFTTCKAGRKILDSISSTDRIVIWSHTVTIGITSSRQVPQVSRSVNKKWKMGKWSITFSEQFRSIIISFHLVIYSVIQHIITEQIKQIKCLPFHEELNFLCKKRKAVETIVI